MLRTQRLLITSVSEPPVPRRGADVWVKILGEPKVFRRHLGGSRSLFCSPARVCVGSSAQVIYALVSCLVWLGKHRLDRCNPTVSGLWSRREAKLRS